MSDFGLNEAVSQANSLTSSVGDHNDMVRGFQQNLRDKLATQLGGIKSDEKRDQMLHGVQQVYGIGTAIHSGVGTFGELRAKGASQFFTEQGAHASKVGRGMLGMDEYNPLAPRGSLGKIADIVSKPTSSFRPSGTSVAGGGVARDDQLTPDQPRTKGGVPIGGESDTRLPIIGGAAVPGAEAELEPSVARGEMPARFPTTGAASANAQKLPGALESTMVEDHFSSGTPPPSSTVGSAVRSSAPSTSPPTGGATQAGQGTNSISTESAGNRITAASDELSNKVMAGFNKASDAASKLGTVAGVGTASYDVFEDFKHHGIVGNNTAEKESNVEGIGAGVLDVASIFLPFLAPVAAVATAASGISGFVGSEESETSAKGPAAQAKAAEGKSAGVERMISAPSLAQSGLIASAQSDNKATIAPSSSSF
tara:strand:+ start:160 stop:1434 length:1275 start_codon:yes stop_codon:yes gene_type:complete